VHERIGLRWTSFWTFGLVALGIGLIARGGQLPLVAIATAWGREGLTAQV
jgi:hypothetical protein